MKTFVQGVKRIANSLHCDGRNLQPPRLGPDPRAVLQKPIDALIVIPEFNVEVARGQAILELSPSCSFRAQPVLHRRRRRC